MSTQKASKIFLLALFFTSFTPTNYSHATTSELDKNGLYSEPSCRIASSHFNAITILGQQDPTGIKAVNDEWHMEIYSRRDGRSWTLVGKSKAPTTGYPKLCTLAYGESNYVEQVWFKKFFSVGQASTSTSAASCPTAPSEGIACETYKTPPKGFTLKVELFVNEQSYSAIKVFADEWERRQTIPVSRHYVNWHKPSRDKSEREITAETMANDLLVDSVPTFVIKGKYRVSIAISKINSVSLAELHGLMDALVAQPRSAR